MGDDDLIRRGDAMKAMADYHWKRYASRADGGTLSSPAVFTSHTWQDVQDAIAAAPAEDVRARAQAQAREAWRIAGMVTNNDEAMQVHQAICALFKIDTARPDDAQEAKP